MSTPRDMIYRCFELVGLYYMCKNCGSKLKKRNEFGAGSTCSSLKQHVFRKKCMECGDYKVFLEDDRAAPRDSAQKEIQRAKDLLLETGEMAASSDSSSSSQMNDVASGSEPFQQEPQQGLATAMPVQDQDQSAKAEVVGTGINNKPGEEVSERSKMKRISYLTEEESLELALAMSLSLQDQNSSTLLALETGSPEGQRPLTPSLETVSEAVGDASSSSQGQEDNEILSESAEAVVDKNSSTLLVLETGSPEGQRPLTPSLETVSEAVGDASSSSQGQEDNEILSVSDEPVVPDVYETVEVGLGEVTQHLQEVLQRIQDLQK